jgi:rhamnulokinase
MTADACERQVVSGPVEASAIGNVMLQAIARDYLPSVSAGRESIAESVERNSYFPRKSGGWDEAYRLLDKIHSVPLG